MLTFSIDLLTVNSQVLTTFWFTTWSYKPASILSLARMRVVLLLTLHFR